MASSGTEALIRVNLCPLSPHSAGETRRYEDNVIDLLPENLERRWRGETVLKNQLV